MKKYSLLIASALSALLLAACGTTEDAIPVEGKTTESNSIEQAETQTEATSENDAAINEVEKKAEMQTTEPAKEASTAAASLQSSKTAAATATYTTSPEQDYEVILQDGFSLMAEEPGRDMITYDANDQIWMRVKTMTKEETTYEELAQSTKETAAATAPDGIFETISSAELLAKHADILNATGYKVVHREDDLQTLNIVFEKSEKLVELTIFDTKEAALTDTLLNIGFSIR